MFVYDLFWVKALSRETSVSCEIKNPPFGLLSVAFLLGYDCFYVVHSGSVVLFKVCQDVTVLVCFSLY